MAQKKQPPHTEITFRVNRKLRTGSFFVEDGMVTAYYEDGSQTTQLGGSPAEVVARMLIREMIAKG